MRAILIAVLACVFYVAAKTSGELCDGTATSADGNSYCAEVTKITYQNISQYGSYMATTNMSVDSGLCSHENVSYPGTGNLTPLFGEVSMHLRGPMNLTQLAVYMLSSKASQKRDSDSEFGHKDKRNRRKFGGAKRKLDIQDLQKRDVGDLVIATIDGKVVSWLNVYDGTPATDVGSEAFSSTAQAPTNYTSKTRSTVFVTVTDQVTITPVSTTLGNKAVATEFPCITVTVTEEVEETTLNKAEATSFSQTAAAATSTQAEETTSTQIEAATTTHAESASSTDWTSVQVDSSQQNAATTSPSSAEATTSPQPLVTAKATTGSAVAGSWSRVAYYQSVASAQATGFAFLNHRGNDAVSGTFDTTFGNSLSYASSNGTTCAANRTPFNGNLSNSAVELAIFTDQVCNGDCGYTRPKSVAHHAWSGDAKAFFIEFQADHYNNTPDANQGLIQDAPAWWFLNANIPRVLQYGDDRDGHPCACWSYGCGEFDAFEILAMGENRSKSTLHRQGNLEGGDSNYMLRPVGKTIKMAVIWLDYDITVAILDDSFSFSEALTGDQIAAIVSYDAQSNTDSLFAIGT